MVAYLFHTKDALLPNNSGNHMTSPNPTWRCTGNLKAKINDNRLSIFVTFECISPCSVKFEIKCFLQTFQSQVVVRADVSFKMSRSRIQVGRGWWSFSKGSYPAPSLEICLLQFDQFLSRSRDQQMSMPFRSESSLLFVEKAFLALVREERLGGNILYSFFLYLFIL